MNRWSLYWVVALLLSILTLGCAGGANPALPDKNEGLTQQLDAQPDLVAPTGSTLWGYFDLYFDFDNQKVEVVPNRSEEFTVNIVKFLNNDPLGLMVDFNGTTPGSGFVIVDLDVTIKHPLSDGAFNGYDVRGIFIGNGTQPLKYSTELKHSAKNTDQELLNADGYTRWYNPTEFAVPKIFGYIPGKLATKGYTGTATLNPYKYFGEALGASDSVWNYLNAGDPNIGFFLAGTSNSRNYQIRFPVPTPGVKYGYAVTANWAGTDPQFHPSHAPEAVGVDINDNSTLYYVDNTNKGGNLALDIKVFDWDAELTGGVMEDYSINVESTVQTAKYQLNTSEMTPIVSDPPYYAYHVVIPADNLAGIDGNEMWIVVEDSTADYTNPAGVPNSANTDKIAACFRFPLTVSNEEPTFAVTSPNGGENWKVTSTKDITWTAAPSVENVAISLSLDSGGSYPQVLTASTPNDGSFTWYEIPPEAESPTCRIKVSDAADPDLFDESDSDFIVSIPTIHVTAPNGGEVWKTNTIEDITWTADPDLPTVDIFLSQDSGNTYPVCIAPNIPNNGTFSWGPIEEWTVSDSCRIRVIDNICQVAQDDSDADFQIYKPWLTILTPNGGEEWPAGSTQEITWESSETGGLVDIGYSKDMFVSDEHTIVAQTENDGSFLWEDIPEDISDTVRVGIQSMDMGIADISDADFSITPPAPWITITYPNGGETWKVGGTYEVTWESDPSIQNVKIEVSDDSGITYPYIIEDSIPNTGIYLDGPLPEDAVGVWRMKISDVDNPAVYDESDADYSIIDAWIDLTSPNGGENWEIGSSHEITWECSETGGTVSIIYTKDDFNSDFHDIAPAAPNTGSYTWDSIPDDACDTVRVGLEFSDLLLRDSSDDYFSIDEPGPSITVTSPNGWEDIRANHSFEITWESDGVAGTVNIWYSKDNFVGDIQYIAYGVANTGTFTWEDIPYDPSDTVKVRVESTDNTSVYDDSDSNFTLEDSGWVDVWGGSETDYAEDVAIDGWGNAYVTGYFGISPSESVAYLRKFTPGGAEEWTKYWGAEGVANGYGVGVDSDNNVYVTGRFYGTNVDMDPGPGTALRTSDANGDIFLSRFGPSGNFSFVKTWGGYTQYCGEAGMDLVINTPDLYVTGFFTGTNVDFDPDAGTSLRSSNGGTDAFLSKFSTSGTFAWAVSWGGTDSSYNDEGRGTGMDSSGDIFVAGRFYGSNVDFDPSGGTSLKSSNGGHDAFLVWFSNSSTFRSVWTWGGTGWDSAEAISMGATGMFCTGYFEGSNVDFDPSAGTNLKSSAGLSDAFLTHFNPLIDYQWTQTWGAGGADIAIDLAPEGEESTPVVVGYFSNTVDFDPGAGTYSLASNGAYDAYWTNLDADGNFLGAQTWGGADYETCSSICFNSSGRAFITGAAMGPYVEYAPTDSPCFDNSDAINTLGGYDAFLVKYMPDGCW